MEYKIITNHSIGTIYKITNLINNKIYIGQTRQNYEAKFNQHKSHARAGQNHKLARAFRKYGEENFIIEVIEQCDIDKLDERECYWIKYYNSIDDDIGYNIKTGGKTNSIFYELENQQEIIDYYYQCHNQAETIKKFNITDYKFRQLLIKNNLPTDLTNYGKHKRKKIKIVELDLCFDSEIECSQYLIDNNITKSKKVNCVRVRVADAVHNHKKYRGYTFIEVE